MKRITKFKLTREKIKNEGIMNSIFEDNQDKNKTLNSFEPETQTDNSYPEVDDNLDQENTTKEINNKDILEQPAEEDEEFIKKDILNLDLKLSKLKEKINSNDIFFEEEKKILENNSLEKEIQNKDLKEVRNILQNVEENLIIENSNISSETQLSSYIKSLENIENYVETYKLNNFFKINKKLFNEKKHDFFILKTQINSYFKNNKNYIDKKLMKNIEIRINNLKSIFYNVALTKYTFYFFSIIVFLLLLFVFFTLASFFISGWWK